jgi:hypothetical protein
MKQSFSGDPGYFLDGHAPAVIAMTAFVVILGFNVNIFT